MEQITILVRDKKKGRSLLDLLRSLDFVSVLGIENVETSFQESVDENSREEEFFEAARMWKDRDITIELLREKAWRRQT